MTTEPVLTIGGFISAALLALAAFGVRLTPEQQTAIWGLAPFVMAGMLFWIRSRVTPTSKTIDAP
jgi:hypothetical protein